MEEQSISEAIDIPTQLDQLKKLLAEVNKLVAQKDNKTISLKEYITTLEDEPISYKDLIDVRVKIQEISKKTYEIKIKCKECRQLMKCLSDARCMVSEVQRLEESIEENTQLIKKLSIEMLDDVN